MKLDLDDIIEMALCDHTSFAQIRAQYGVGEAEVKKLMRQNLKPGSYRAWRRRLHEFSDRRANYKQSTGKGILKVQPDQNMLLGRVEADYRNEHMFWIEKRLNRRLERWFRKDTIYEIADLLADKQLNDLQIEVYSFYNKIDYKPALDLSPELYNVWINRVVTGWAIRKSVSVWSKIKMASLLQQQS